MIINLIKESIEKIAEDKKNKSNFKRNVAITGGVTGLAGLAALTTKNPKLTFNKWLVEGH